MKKLLVLTLTLALSISFLGSYGCSNETALSFTNGDLVTSAGSFNPGYTQQLKYTVSLNENYSSPLKKSEVISNEILQYSYSGIYTQTFKVYTSLDLVSLSNDFSTDISTEDTYIYGLQTKLEIDANYTYQSKEETYQDTIESEVYFLPANYSFAPIYSITKVNTTTPYVIEENSVESVKIVNSTYETSVFYNTSSYTVKTVADEKISSETKEYTFKTILDNNELLFCSGFFNISVSSGKSVPVVTGNYIEKQKLYVSNASENTQEITLNINSEKNTYSIPQKNYNYYAYDTNQSGKPHYVSYQTENVVGLGNNCFLLSYVEPLAIYYKNTYVMSGGLEFKLTDINITK